MEVATVLGVALALGGLVSAAPWEVAATATAGAVLVLASGARRRYGLVLVAFALLAIGAWRAQMRIDAHEAVMERAAIAMPHTARCFARGRVTSSPVVSRGTARWSAEVHDVTCDGDAVESPGSVVLYGGPGDLARGDEVEIVAQLAPPTRLFNRDDPRPLEARHGGVRSGGVAWARVEVRSHGVLAWIDRARAHVRDRIDATFPPDLAPMARALVLGEWDLDAVDDVAIRASGLAHLLAVSGMHLVLVVLGSVAALRSLLARWAALAARVDVGRIAAGMGIVLGWAYAEFAGMGGSTTRAAWMTTVVLVARAIGRRSNGPRAFGLSLLGMALADPLVGFDASFALSAAATAGLLAHARPIGAWMTDRVPGWLGPVARSMATTLAATIPCAPLLARFTPTLPLGGVVANVVAVPIGEAAALPLCLLHAMLGWFPSAQQGSALLASGALRLVQLLARGFAMASALAVPTPRPTGAELAIFGVTFAAVIVLPKGKRLPFALAGAALALIFELGAIRAGAPKGVLRATFLDVGQGDAAIVDLPNGEAIAIDSGGLVGSPIDTGARVLAPELRARRRSELALAILSHPHPDHFGGFATGLARTRVLAVWDSGQGEREGVAGGYADFLAQSRAGGASIVHPEAFCGPRVLGGATVDVLAPCPTTDPDRGPNDNSIVVRIAYGARALLFVGDAEGEEEQDLLKLPPERLRADVLKVGHHGSRTSSSPAFLRAVAPREAVISVGARNRFGHPSPDALASLSAANARIWRTDRVGAVTVTTDGTTLDITAATQYEMAP